MSGFRLAPSWDQEVAGLTDRLMLDVLGPAIAADAYDYCPKATGELADSIEYHLDGHDLIVSASGGADGRAYAVYVEMGHYIAHGPHMSLVGPERKEAEPYLRPALYQVRT